VSIIGGLANIKRLRRDNARQRLLLLSESHRQEDYAPIVISENDDFVVEGKVVDVVKGVRQ
jgi:SOS-response transcriptional repressor LexA